MHALSPMIFDYDWSQRSAELEYELLSAVIDQLELDLIER
jgi:hypothetical protein